MPGVVTEDIDAIYQRTGEQARAERDRLQGELDELNEERQSRIEAIRKLDKLLAFIEPKPPKPKQRQQSGKRAENVAARHAELTDWLRANVNGGRFVAPEILAREDFAPLNMSKSYLAKMLNDLQDLGVIRLVKVGHSDYGNRTKTWEVIGSGSKA